MLNMTWEFKLEPTPEQIALFEQILVVCRQVWNFAGRESKDWLNSRKSPVNAGSIVQEYILSPAQPYPNYQVQAKRLTEAFIAVWRT
jgi:putative transposase